MNQTASSGGASDPFTKYWSEMMGHLSAGQGASPGGSQASNPFGAFGPSQEEVARQMRQAFFDSWARYAEDYMRSDAFLDAMKKSMEQALAFKQQVNEFLTKSLRESQMPTQDDTDSILLAVRRLEERVLDRLAALTRRVEGLEARHDASNDGMPTVGSKPRTKGAAK